jgi:hypothetical protein
MGCRRTNKFSGKFNYINAKLEGNQPQVWFYVVLESERYVVKYVALLLSALATFSISNATGNVTEKKHEKVHMVTMVN